MKSFRTEIEDPIVEQDILDLEARIRAFKGGEIQEEKFRSLRLARGVYGQRQQGVQMVRIKIPYGKLNAAQLTRIADVADEYSTGRLHITTRQDIQIHYVDLERTPELWAELEKDKVTMREACGNTVRNVTASELAGIDPEEPFDVSPYAQALFEYFLRNPVGQELGRKFKVSFSSSESDTGLSYMHDLGFIAKVSEGVKGFKVMIGGGLGSQPRQADVLYEFLETDRIIPLMEAVLRVFDRFGERKVRAKARMKFLLKELGLDEFRKLLEIETRAVPFSVFSIEGNENTHKDRNLKNAPESPVQDHLLYEQWQKTNVVNQKQKGSVAIGIKVFLGDFYTHQARSLAKLIHSYAGDEIRLTLRQNILIPFVPVASLPFFYNALKQMGLADPGYNTSADITACPGTDTCNLGIASSTGIATELERIIREEYPNYVNNSDIVIKISGCMNACGQHSMAHIGFQGMSIRTPDKRVAPALQVLLGGGNLGDGRGVFADKVCKIPSKRGPDALRQVLDDYEKNGKGQPYHSYYAQKGQMYFYDLLKPLLDTQNLRPSDFVDWGASERYEKAIGVGECAGVIIDLVSTLFLESDEKLAQAQVALEEGRWAVSIYYSYSALINTAKALLTAEDVNTNTHMGIIQEFDALFIRTQRIEWMESYEDFVLKINQEAPGAGFANSYFREAGDFINRAKEYRKQELNHA
ncbi:sulfite reductase (ferredoxin) [Muriicola jejuensis]|uniref:HEPN domain-containing protein n=1 Tax=Muriicola jejuensis TaxID=504488 RepID=A0A6P0UDQ5_9FLAO|nr:HEPN domain-containing protein [Muriicola jejuensis]NER09393.1 HEPN domain-containing protein [Muriicola jejuensis]SMP08906.1 sulfite reductase (ferredoxin) [Muriicola jejuensis]